MVVEAEHVPPAIGRIGERGVAEDIADGDRRGFEDRPGIERDRHEEPVVAVAQRKVEHHERRRRRRRVGLASSIELIESHAGSSNVQKRGLGMPAKSSGAGIRNERRGVACPSRRACRWRARSRTIRDALRRTRARQHGLTRRAHSRRGERVLHVLGIPCGRSSPAHRIARPAHVSHARRTLSSSAPIGGVLPPAPAARGSRRGSPRRPAHVRPPCSNQSCAVLVHRRAGCDERALARSRTGCGCQARPRRSIRSSCRPALRAKTHVVQAVSPAPPHVRPAFPAESGRLDRTTLPVALAARAAAQAASAETTCPRRARRSAWRRRRAATLRTATAGRAATADRASALEPT